MSALGPRNHLAYAGMNSEEMQRYYADDRRTNGTDDAKEPLAIAVTERRFGQTWPHHPGREDGQPRRRSSAARSGSGEIFIYIVQIQADMHFDGRY